MADEEPTGEDATEHAKPLKLLGEAPSSYDIITRQGVVDALWGILEDAHKDTKQEGSQADD